MFDKKTTKRFFRRNVLNRKKTIDDLGENTEKQIDKHFFKRINNLTKVRRYVAGWFILIALLIFVGFFQLGALRDRYQPLKFVSGGIFTEGIVGSYTNSNPIFATNSVDSSVSKLLYASLFTYDAKSNLVPDLAESMQIDKTEKIYTVKLKQNLTWQDGQPLTAKDVVFTFNTIKDPTVNSFLAPGWNGIDIKATDNLTVVFTLKSILGPFPQSLVTGILPEHILKDVPKDQLRSSNFNTVSAVGSGPFKLDKVEVGKGSQSLRSEKIGLVPFDNYHKGRPALGKYIIKTYDSQEDLKKAFNDKQISAASDVSTIFNDQINDDSNTPTSVNLAAQTMVFFKNSQGVLKDPVVRKALVEAVNKNEVIAATGLTYYQVTSLL